VLKYINKHKKYSQTYVAQVSPKIVFSDISILMNRKAKAQHSINFKMAHLKEFAAKQEVILFIEIKALSKSNIDH